MAPYYAHSRPERPLDSWHLLSDHQRHTAELASRFADSLGFAAWGYLAGWLHDLGKSSPQFQSYLRQSGLKAHLEQRRGSVDHTTAGAQAVVRLLPELGKLLAYAVAGHHGGLLDGRSNGACLQRRLEKQDAPKPDWGVETEDAALPEGLPLPFDPRSSNGAGFQLAFFVRMLFSCLVDADFLDTERFFRPEQSTLRSLDIGLRKLKERLDPHLEGLAQDAQREDSPLGATRADILAACRRAALQDPGLFSLTVPTGGGKTLASLAFALDHALSHGLDRVIYVIPYTSIIEQTARVFRKALGEEAVVEHHSNFEPSDEDHFSRLAAENWDAPVVVTTNVQFFESLFAARTSRCRKLHRIGRSVVVLDEAQMLPVDFLWPCLAALRELTSRYGTTAVLCTATQPALKAREGFKRGLERVREIIENPEELARKMRRVEVVNLGQLCDEPLAKRLESEPQALCIVNSRKHAAQLFGLLAPGPGRFHLSARMCPEHRSRKIGEIRQALVDQEPCLVVSTQLVEAGVDLDFPKVYRAMAGLDSLAQAGGRCNREGRAERGQVYLFEPEHRLPPGLLTHAAQSARAVLRTHEDPLSLEALEAYFKDLYWSREDRLDDKKILERMEKGAPELCFPFRTVAEEFRLIETAQLPVVVPYDKKARQLLDDLERVEMPGKILRRLQAYTVGLPEHEFAALHRAGAVYPVRDLLWALEEQTGFYHQQLGLIPPEGHTSDPLIP